MDKVEIEKRNRALLDLMAFTPLASANDHKGITRFVRVHWRRQSRNSS